MWYQDELLRAALTSQHIPEPTAGFVERALAQAKAAEPERHSQPGWGVAATVAVGIAVLLATVLGLRELPPAEVALSREPQPRMVNVVVTAKDHRENATIRIRLAEDLELEGHAGLHLIEWQTDLERGRNLMVLPVRSKTGSGGDIWIALSHGGMPEQELHIRVDAG